MCSEQIEPLLEVVASRQQYAARRQLCCREDPRSEAADPNLATTGEAFGEITQALGLDPRTLDRWLADRDDKHAEPSSGVAQKASEPAAEAADL